jgi:hypothetical protein
VFRISLLKRKIKKNKGMSFLSSLKILKLQKLNKKILRIKKNASWNIYFKIKTKERF